MSAQEKKVSSVEPHNWLPMCSRHMEHLARRVGGERERLKCLLDLVKNLVPSDSKYTVPRTKPARTQSPDPVLPLCPAPPRWTRIHVGRRLVCGRPSLHLMGKGVGQGSAETHADQPGPALSHPQNSVSERERVGWEAVPSLVPARCQNPTHPQTNKQTNKTLCSGSSLCMFG